MSRLWRGLKTVVQTPTASPANSYHYHTIQAILRESTGSRISSRDRAQGRIPTVVFSQGLLHKNPTNRSPSRKQLLTTERKQIQAIIKDEESGKILNLVFAWADEGTELKVDVPVIFKGEEDCPGIKKGGYFNRIRTSLKFIGPAEHIPQKIEVDVSKLDIDDRVFMHDVEVHPSLKLLSKNESMPICKVVPTYFENPEPMKV
ncbi:hypothetical protein CRYUN_Cryun24cG0024700 [Craigia yunnanensis]